MESGRVQSPDARHRFWAVVNSLGREELVLLGAVYAAGLLVPCLGRFQSNPGGGEGRDGRVRGAWARGADRIKPACCHVVVVVAAVAVYYLIILIVFFMLNRPSYVVYTYAYIPRR